jgi:4,5-DOPA dioxygenase extradiol
MFPDADIPVVPVSVQPHLGTEHAWRVGRALSKLGEKNIMVIASGNVTHNLGDWHSSMQSGSGTPEYVERFSNWVYDAIMNEKKEALIGYRLTNPDGIRSHPSDEHFLPLLTAAAAGEGVQAKAFFRGISDTVITMDCYQWTQGEANV